MNIITKKTLDVTPALETYIEQKLSPIGKLIAHFEHEGDIDLYLEVARTSDHHNKGDEVYMAAADLKLPHKGLRAEVYADDIHSAIDKVREILHADIEKYKAQHTDHHRGEKER